MELLLLLQPLPSNSVMRPPRPQPKLPMKLLPLP
jgi:hypothetical protein